MTYAAENQTVNQTPNLTATQTANWGYATITLSRHRSAQGPILRHLRDGRVVIDAGQGEVTGRPVNPITLPAKGRLRAAASWMPLFGGLH